MTEDTRRNPASDDPCPLKADARRIDDLVHQRSRVQRRARSARRVVIPLVRRFGLNPVLGYLGAGAILGPLGLGSFIESFPLLYWFTVVDPKNVSGIANLGVVFLLFLIGMELSYDRLKAMRRLRVRQLADRTLLGGDRRGRGPVGNKAPVALILGACLALSSTAIVVEILSRQRRLSTSAGRASFATLLAQDLAVAPLLLFISIFGASESGSVVATLVLALTNAAVALAVIVIVSRVVMRPLFRLVASVGMSDLFVATTLFVIVATGVAGFSMALGAFVAGLLLAETEFRKAIETAIDPFKGLLLGLFFFTVGMNIKALLPQGPLRSLQAAPLGSMLTRPRPSGWCYGSNPESWR
jgi:monovalent cation:H+ antiporter-2, CPA2 family